MRDYSTHREKSIEPKKHSKKYVFSGIIIILLIIVLIFSLPWKNILTMFGSKETTDTTPDETKSIIPQIFKPKTSKELVTEIQSITKPLGGTVSYYVYDIRKKQGFGDNEEMVITAASVNKVPILAALYNLAGKGEIDLEKVIILQQSDIQDYGSGSIRYDPVGTPYSLKTLSRLMMEQSDNTAAYILGTLTIGLDKIQNLIESWGLTQTDMVNNKTSAKDMSILFTKMYLGEITTKALTTEMLGFMDKSDFDDRIPKALDNKYKIYHKTGDEIGKIHDAAIIDLPGNPYFLGIFTLDSTDETATKKVMIEITRMVNNFMKN